MTEHAIEASRALAPYFYRAPHPESMTPRAFQLAGAEYCLSRKHAILGDAPGLGKTAEAILIGNAIEAKRTLVVCPASLRLNWQREIWYWSTIRNVLTYPVLKSSDGISPQHHYNIISYALLANKSILQAILDLRWDHVILDEAHAIKDPHGNTRTKAITGWNEPHLTNDGAFEYIWHRRIPEVTGRSTLATGTLLPNQPIECYNAIRLLDWEAINRTSLDSFREYYYGLGGGMIRGPVFDTKLQAIVTKLHWSDEVRNVPQNLADLQYRLRKHLMVRRLTKDVMPQLPPIQWHPFPLALTAEIRRALKHPGWKQAEKLYEFDPHAFDRGIPIDGEISTARRLLGEAKAPAVVEYIKDLLAQGTRKIVVSAWHHSVLDYLREKLTPHGLVYMDGTTSAKRKQAVVDAFQENDKIAIILGQMQPLGQGWTLTAAQDVVLAEFDWVPGNNEQMLLRISRMGQEGSYTLGHIPVVPDSMDERLLGTAIAKDQTIYQALDAQ